MTDTTQIRKRLDTALAQQKLAVAIAEKEATALAEATTAVADTTAAQHIIQQVAQAVQQEVHSRIAGVVTSCMSAVFDEPYAFDIRFERKRGRTEARLLFTRNGMEIDPLTASGGGVVDVAAFALRLACLALSNPPVRKVLIMDEPFRFVSAGYRHRVRALIEQLSEEMGVQFVIVTHIISLEIGEIVEIGRQQE